MLLKVRICQVQKKPFTIFWKQKYYLVRGKAANAGGVAVSGLEMTQNSMRLAWTREEVDTKLHTIMKNIHEMCVKYGKESAVFTNYVRGANIVFVIRKSSQFNDGTGLSIALPRENKKIRAVHSARIFYVAANNKNILASLVYILFLRRFRLHLQVRFLLHTGGTNTINILLMKKLLLLLPFLLFLFQPLCTK